MADDDRLARVALCRLGEPGDLRLARLVEELGAPAVRDLLVEEGVPGLPRRSDLPTQDRDDLRLDVAARTADLEPAADLALAERRGIRFVVPGDDEWPAGLDELARCEPVQRRGGAPLGLWVRGRRLDELLGPAVAVVGSRSATGYGTGVAADLGAEVAAAGTCVVSGAAFGIDQAAHRAALAVEGPTVAVLACGVDRAYPAAHRTLLELVADRGAVVSELPPGCAPTRVRFLARNRLIAAVSGGTVVVEAAVRSGALNTAHWAGRLHRPVMGVPGPVTSAPSEGVHELIRSRDATLVTRGAEVLEMLGDGGRALDPPRAHERVRDRLAPLAREVLEGVPVHQAAPTASIARAVGLAPGRVSAALADLSVRGLVVAEVHGWRLAPVERGGADRPAEAPTLPL